MKTLIFNIDKEKAAKIVGNAIVAVVAAGALVYNFSGVAMQIAHFWNK